MEEWLYRSQECSEGASKRGEWAERMGGKRGKGLKYKGEKKRGTANTLMNLWCKYLMVKCS